MRQTLINAYFDYFNNYATIDKYAEHNGLTYRQAEILLELGKALAETPHPDA